MNKLKMAACCLVLIAGTFFTLTSCQRCKTCKYINASGNTPSPETQYCDDELTAKEKDPNLTCS